MHSPDTHTRPPQSALVQHAAVRHRPPQHLLPVPQSESDPHDTHAPAWHSIPAAQSVAAQHAAFVQLPPQHLNPAPHSASA